MTKVPDAVIRWNCQTQGYFSNSHDKEGYCASRESNPDGLPHRNLNPARLPIPPLARSEYQSRAFLPIAPVTVNLAAHLPPLSLLRGGKSPFRPKNSANLCWAEVSNDVNRHGTLQMWQKGGCIVLGLKQTGIIVAALTAFTVQPAVSKADGRFYRDHRSRIDVDIDSLDAEIRYARGHWQLRVWYDVEVEDMRRYDRLDLVLTLKQRGRPLLDSWGRPLTIVIPLDYPTEVDRDKVEFKRSRVFTLPDYVIERPRRLKLHAKVVMARCGSVLDRKSESIDFRRGFRAPRRAYVEPFGPRRSSW